MKKLLVFSMAALLVAAFCLPASALENVFGGYWRTRGFTQNNFDGQDTETQDLSRVDTRTRLYYTAVLNDNLKFVNKFEMNAVWGGQDGDDVPDSYGDIGTDGLSVRVKNSYADFNTGPVNHKLGAQGAVFQRGFVFDDDFAGYVGTWKLENMWFRGTWIKPYEGGTGKNQNKLDFDAVGGEAQFALGEAGSIIPYVVYGWSEDSSEYFDDDELDTASIFWLGLDADFTLGTVGLWFSGGYVGGTIDATSLSGNSDTDVSGYVLAGGGSVPLGPASIHASAFYASGDDDLTDDDRDGWFGLSESYYWSEIMGLGVFDNQASAGSPGGGVSNIWAAQLGATIKPFDKLSITGDLWYAALVEKEESLTDKKPLGFEVDLRITYELVEGMNLDLVGAYLFADDATSNTIDKNDKDPWEIGWQTSLSF